MVSILDRLRMRLKYLGLADPMRGFLSYGSLRVEHIDTDPMCMVPLAPWAMLPLAQAVATGVQDTHLEKCPVVLCFANTSWRLLVASRIVVLPDFGGGGSFGTLGRAPHRTVVARLYLQPQGKTDPNAVPLRGWDVMIEDDNAMGLFLNTAIAYSMPIHLPHRSLMESLRDEPPDDADEDIPL
jgi:hypothetical protein